MLLLAVISFIVLQHGRPTRAEFYSSVHQMSKLVEYEHTFLQIMDKYVTENENKLDFLKARLTEFEIERAEALSAGAAYFESPVNKYLLTKRLTVDWERIENLMQFNAGEKTLKKMEKLESPLGSATELDGALAGLLRMQEIYRFRTKDIAEGILNNKAFGDELEARHCFDLGVFALKQDKLRLAHSWVVEALHRFEQEQPPAESITDQLDKSFVLSVLADLKYKLGDLRGTNETIAELLQLQPHNETIARAQAAIFEEVDAHEINDLSDEHGPLPIDVLQTDPNDRFKLTCSGHISQSPREERELHCGYLTETHPFLLIAPIKVEELNHDPLLVIYHDVIADSEIAVIRELTENAIKRATITGNNGTEVSAFRTSQIVFLPPTAHRVLQTIDRRVVDMTNLNMNFAEMHQCANYGIGGHYAPHYDSFVGLVNKSTITNPETGDRIASVLFYLTDVEEGGGTAFPFLKRLLLPKKGAAAFWHNLHASGASDLRTLHGACPIIVGSKWVLNRWIREHDQSDRRPCELFDDTLPAI